MRQSVLTILIGAISTLVGLTAIDYLRGRRCADLAGKWLASARQCELPSGEHVGTGTAIIFVIGAVIALGVGLMLYRAMLFASGRLRRPTTG